MNSAVVTLEMVAAGEAVFRDRCGNMLPESKADCEAAAISIYSAMERVRAEYRPSLQGDVVERVARAIESNCAALQLTDEEYRQVARAALDACSDCGKNKS